MKPHQVVIESTYQERNLRPTPPDHKFDLQSPGLNPEPYFPEIHIEDYALPEDFPQNIQLSWLAKFSGGFAEIFLGDKGALENAIRQYQSGDLEKAQKKLKSLLNSSSQIQEQAALWLAWIYYKKSKFKNSFDTVKPLLSTQDSELKKEAYFLSSLLFIKQQQFKLHYLTMQHLKMETEIKNWGFRVQLAYLVSLAELGYWSEAESFLRDSEISEVRHAKTFYMVEEITGLIRYATNNFKKSLEHYQKAKSLNKDLSYQRKLNRIIAWLLYFNKMYEDSLSITHLGKDAFHQNASEEIIYLESACLVKLNRWEKVINVLDKLNADSEFRIYAAFQVRTYLKDSVKYPALQAMISIQNCNEPNMRFYAAFHEGNQAFNRRNFKKAENRFLRAMSVDLKSSDYWTLQYNLGLTYLKRLRFNRAKAIFQALLENKFVPKLVAYHLLYSQYKLRDNDAFLTTLKQFNVQQLPPDIQNQISLMKAGVYVDKKMSNQAVVELVNLWNQSKLPAAFELAIKILYSQRRFSEIIDLVNSNRSLKSDVVFTYTIKAYLGNRDFKTAYKTLKNRRYLSDQYIFLRIEVLLAAQKHQELIKLITPLLANAADAQTRLLYYLALGDAFYNLGRYLDAKQQFYKALKLTNKRDLRSLVFYSIAQTTYHNQDFALFENEMDFIIKQSDLTDEIRYSLTQMLVDYYWKNGKPDLADHVLEKYAENHGYQRSNANAKRMRLLYQSNKYGRCFSLGKNNIESKNKFNRRDSVIMVGYCGNKTTSASEAVEIMRNELKSQQFNYRRDELIFVLAQGYSNLKQHEKSYDLVKDLMKKSLKPEIKRQAQLLLSHSAAMLGKQKDAVAALGDIDQYRQTDDYPYALKVKSRLHLNKNEVNLAVRSLLRIYYLPEIDEKQKQETLLNIAELYMNRKMIKKAGRFLNKIDEEVIAKREEDHSRYRRLKKRLAPK